MTRLVFVAVTVPSYGYVRFGQNWYIRPRRRSRTSPTTIAEQHTSRRSWEAKIVAYLIHIRNCPTLSNGKLDFQFLPCEVRPTPWGIICCPVVIQIMIESQMIGSPAVVSCRHAL